MNMNRLVRIYPVCIALALASLCGATTTAWGAEARVKPRTIVTTDGEVDDCSSMLRFFLYTCDFDVVGIIQVNSSFQQSGHSKEKWIEAQLEQYEKIHPNLVKHKSGYPAANTLRGLLRVGNEHQADLQVSPDKMGVKNTEGEKLIIQTLLDHDPRPVHIQAWGGLNTVASALWRLKYSGEYTKPQFEHALTRVRIYAIWFQDGGGKWIENNVKEARIYEACQWHKVWDYSSVNAESKNPTQIKAFMDTTWLNANVKQNHGAYGAMYPQGFVSEGDSPSYFNLIDNGLESHLDYTLGGWGGRGIHPNPTEKPNYLTDLRTVRDDGDANKVFWRWVPAAQNDFAARMDWTTTRNYAEANHQPVAVVQGPAVREVAPGATVTLDAGQSTDPDGNRLAFTWWQYADADTAKANVSVSNAKSSKASFVVPSEPGTSLHVICEVKDDGEPALTSYRRVIFKIVDKPTGGSGTPTHGAAPATPTFPLKVSENKRYLQDAGGKPFFLLGEGAW